jgi:hypothetical protein
MKYVTHHTKTRISAPIWHLCFSHIYLAFEKSFKMLQKIMFLCLFGAELSNFEWVKSNWNQNYFFSSFLNNYSLSEFILGFLRLVTYMSTDQYWCSTCEVTLNALPVPFGFLSSAVFRFCILNLQIIEHQWDIEHSSSGHPVLGTQFWLQNGGIAYCICRCIVTLQNTVGNLRNQFTVACSASARISKGQGYQVFTESSFGQKRAICVIQGKTWKMDRIALLLGSIKCLP